MGGKRWRWPGGAPTPPEQLHTPRGTERGLVRVLNLEGPAGVVGRVTTTTATTTTTTTVTATATATARAVSDVTGIPSGAHTVRGPLIRSVSSKYNNNNNNTQRTARAAARSVTQTIYYYYFHHSLEHTRAAAPHVVTLTCRPGASHHRCLLDCLFV